MQFTEEQLSTELDSTMTLSEVIVCRSSVVRRLKDKRNNIRNMRANDKPEHLIGFVQRDIERLERTLRTLDNIIADSF